MDSSQALLNERRHKDDIDPVLPWPPAAKVRRDEPKVAASHATTISSEQVDISAEESCPAPGPQSLASDARQREAAIETAQAPSATTFELMNQLDALAQDLAAKSHALIDQRIESDQRSEAESVRETEQAEEAAEEAEVAEEAGSPAALPAPEPSIRVSPRPTGFENDPLASTDPLARSGGSARRIVFKLVGMAAALLLGVGATVAWQSYRVSTAKPPTDAGVATERAHAQAAAAPAAIPQSAPAAQVAQVAQVVPAPVAPEVAKQLETMAQDLALVRRSVDQLTAKQEQLAAVQQQLEQLAAKQEKLAAKQEQMAQSIAKLQPREPAVRPRVSTPSRSAPVSPRVSAVPPPAQVPAQLSPPPPPQVSSAPPSRSAEPHPLPPLPVPQ